jgi:hypothetical protein
MKQVVLLLLLTSSLRAAYPVVDYFRRTSVQTNWTQTTASAFNVSAEMVNANNAVSGVNMLLWTLDAAPNDAQYSEALTDSGWTSSRNGNTYGGVGVRLDSSKNGYGCVIMAQNGDVRSLRIVRFDAGVRVDLSTDTNSGTAVSSGNRLRMTANGSSLTCNLYSGLTGTTDLITSKTATDSTYTSGRVGFVRNLSNVAWDDWHGGNLGDPEPPRTWSCTECFVSLSGTTIGDGSKAAPLTQNWWLSKSDSMPAGTKFWLRGGTYSIIPTQYFEAGDVFQLHTAGTSGNLTTHRAYPGETVYMDPATRATSAGNNYDGWRALSVLGDYTRIRDFRLIESDTERLSCGGIHRTSGLYVAANGVEVINNWIYDNWAGIESNNANKIDWTYRGNLIANNGDVGNSGVFGHAIYAEHNGNNGVIEGNIFHNHFDNTVGTGNGGRLQFYSQSSQPVKNVHFKSNSVMGNNNVIISTQDISNFEFANNRMYGNRQGLNFYQDTSPCQTGIKFNGNHIHDAGFYFRGVVGSEFSSNVIGTTDNAQKMHFSRLSADANCDTIAEQFSVLNNNYYYAWQSGASDFIVEVDSTGSTSYTLSGWQTQTGKDGSSTQDTTTYPAYGATAGASATNYTYTWISPDEPMAYVTVFDYKHTGTVAYDPSSFLNNGDPYEIIDTQCFLCAPIATGTYTSGTINLDTSLTSVTVPLGNYTDDPVTYCGPGSGVPLPTQVHTSEDYNVYIIRRPRTLKTVNFEVYNSVTNATQVRLVLGLTPTNLDWPTHLNSSCSASSRCSISIDNHWVGKMYYRWEFLSAGGAILAQSDVQPLVIN